MIEAANDTSPYLVVANLTLLPFKDVLLNLCVTAKAMLVLRMIIL